SNRAANHENAVTSAPAWAPGKASLKMPQSGSRCTTAKPNALEKPMTTAATGAHRLRVKTRISVPTAPAVCTLPAQNTSAVSRSKPRRKWSAPWTINATAKTTAAYRRMRSSARGGAGFAGATTTLDSGSRAVRPKRRGYAGRTGREDERLDRSGAGQGKDRRVDRRHRGRRVRRGRARSGYVVLWERVTPGHGDWHDRRGTRRADVRRRHPPDPGERHLRGRAESHPAHDDLLPGPREGGRHRDARRDPRPEARPVSTDPVQPRQQLVRRRVRATAAPVGVGRLRRRRARLPAFEP